MAKDAYPRMMVHPAHVKGSAKQVKGNDPVSGRPFTDYQGTPDRYPPTEARDENEEAYYRAKGYYPQGETQPMNAVAYAEYPKMMEHPKFEEAVQAQPEIRTAEGVVLQQPRDNKPAKFGPVTVNTKAEEDAWAKKGYLLKGKSDPDAVQRSAAMPHDPNRGAPSEYPKMVNGVLTQDPAIDASGFQEYPKWVGDKLVNTRAEEEALRPKKTPEELEAERIVAAKAKREAALKALEEADAELTPAETKKTAAK